MKIIRQFIDYDLQRMYFDIIAKQIYCFWFTVYKNIRIA